MVPGASAVAHDLRFRDLGPLVVRIAGSERSPGGPRPAAALALLLINANRRVDADALREALWGDGTGSRAASTLETHIFRLRKVVEPARRPGEPPAVVLSEPGGYRLIVAPDQVDSIRFAQLADDSTELLRTGQADRARRKSEEALGLWRGRPFESVADEIWAAPMVTRLLEVRAQLQEIRLQALLDEGDPAQALRDIAPILAEYPLRERLWAQRMLACYRCGRVEDALDTYRRARRHLLEELGVEPGTELRDLQAAVLAGDESRLGRRPASAAASPVPDGPVNLPRRTGSLFGREDDLDRIRAWCGTGSVLSIVGAGGCGKTRLAVEAARGLVDEFVDGVWFVDLTSVPDGDQVADAVVSTLGLAPASAGRPVEMLRSFVRDRRMLLVLDNCEHVVEGVAELVDALLVPGSELAVLATSREPLQVADEMMLTLGPLPVPAPPDDPAVDPAAHQPVDPVELMTNPAVRLFLERAGSRVGDAAGRPDELALVARICRSVDGVPLAVELAAARARAYSLTEIARQVAGDPTALAQVRRGAPTHQQSVWTAVEWSHRMLTATQQLVHRRVSIIAGPFTTTVAARLCDLTDAEAESVLVGLVHRSMIVPVGPVRPAGPTQFAQLATIRAHGRQELSTHHETDAVGRLRDRWVVDLIRARPRSGHPDERHWFNAVEDDLAGIRGTLHDTLRQRPDPVGCFVAARLTMFWYFHGLVPEGSRWLALARDVPGAAAFDSALATFGQAAERGLAQRMDAAGPLISEGLRLGADRTPEQDVVFGEALVQLAGGVMLVGDQAMAADLAARALRIAERLGDEPLGLIARARLAMNPLDSAADAAPEIYREATEAGNYYAAHQAANGAMVRALALGDVGAGLRWSDRVIGLNRGHDVGQAPVVLEIRANLLTLAGQPVEAVRLYSAARFHNARAGVPWPSRVITATLLARATARLDRTRFEDAWQAGRHLTLADIEPITDDLGSVG